MSVKEANNYSQRQMLTDLLARTKQVDRLTADMESLKAKNSELESRLTAKAAVIEELEAQNAELKDALSSKTAELESISASYDACRKENEQMTAELIDLKEKLNERSIESDLSCLDSKGSLEEAVLKLSGVFQATDKAAKTYLDAVKLKSENIDRIIEEKRSKAEWEAEKILSEARKTREEADKYNAQAHEEAEKYWNEVRAKMSELFDAHSAPVFNAAEHKSSVGNDASEHEEDF